MSKLSAGRSPTPQLRRLLRPASLSMPHRPRLESADSLAASPTGRGPIAATFRTPGDSPSLLRKPSLPVKVYLGSSVSTLRRTGVRPHRGWMWLTATPAPWMAPARWYIPPDARQFALRNMPYGQGAPGRCRIRSSAEHWRKHFHRGSSSRRRSILNMSPSPSVMQSHSYPSETARGRKEVVLLPGLRTDRCHLLSATRWSLFRLRWVATSRFVNSWRGRRRRNDHRLDAGPCEMSRRS